MNRKQIIAAMILILAGFASAAFQYEVVVADQYARGNVVSGRDYFVRVTQGSGTLYMLDHINTLWSANQRESVLNNVTDFGFINLTTGESGSGRFDNTIITYQQAMNQWNDVVTQTGYAIGTFSEGDEVAIWVTDNHGFTGASVGERGEPYVDDETSWRNWGVQSDALGNPAGQLHFRGGGSVFFGLTGVQGDLTGVPLPGTIAALLIGSAFLTARRKGFFFARAG